MLVHCCRGHCNEQGLAAQARALIKIYSEIGSRFTPQGLHVAAHADSGPRLKPSIPRDYPHIP